MFGARHSVDSSLIGSSLVVLPVLFITLQRTAYKLSFYFDSLL